MGGVPRRSVTRRAPVCVGMWLANTTISGRAETCVLSPRWFAAAVPLSLVRPKSVFCAMSNSDGWLLPKGVSFGAKYSPFETRTRTPLSARLARARVAAAGVVSGMSSAVSKPSGRPVTYSNARSHALGARDSFSNSLYIGGIIPQNSTVCLFYTHEKLDINPQKNRTTRGKVCNGDVETTGCRHSD